MEPRDQIAARLEQAERELDTWKRRRARAQAVLDPNGAWAASFRAEHGRPSARAERMAAALRVLGLPAVRDPKLSVEVEKLTGYLAVGLDGHTALERTLAESQYDTLDALRQAPARSAPSEV